MGWSEVDGRCRRHPKHRQSKGVCPSCLRERLSQLSASSSSHNSTFSSLGSSYDSATSSAPSSTPGTPSATQSHRHRHRHRHRRRDATAKIALLMKEKGENPLLGRAPEPLTKSRSLAFVISNPFGGGKEKKKGKAGDDEEDKKKESKEEEGKQQQHQQEEEEEEEKKKGFWSKLAVGGKKRKGKDALFHSKTVRESSSARWTFLP